MIKWQAHQAKISRNPITHSATLSRNFEVLKSACTKLIDWLPTLSIEKEDQEITLTHLNNSKKFLSRLTTFSNFKRKIWVKTSKRVTYMEQCNARLTADDFLKVKKSIITYLQLLHQLWLSFAPYIRQVVFSKLGYVWLEGQLWMLYFHIELYGIRSSSLLQISTNKINFQLIDREKDNTPVIIAVCHFEGDDKSQEGADDRVLALGTLTEELCYYIKERLPFIREKFNQRYEFKSIDEDFTGMFFSQYGAQMKEDSFNLIAKRFYGILLSKYTTLRLIRFNLRHEIYSSMKLKTSEDLSLLCYMFNHNISTHLTYYVMTNHNQQFAPSKQQNLLNNMLYKPQEVTTSQEVNQQEEEEEKEEEEEEEKENEEEIHYSSDEDEETAFRKYFTFIGQ